MIADHGNDMRRAEEHVAEAQRIVHTQKGLLIRLKAAGVDTSDAERRLRLYETILRRFVEHRNILKAEDRNILKAEESSNGLREPRQGSPLNLASLKSTHLDRLAQKLSGIVGNGIPACPANEAAVEDRDVA